ncbi:hypothetical protein HGM15179_020715, partial [Zosterops borbonicus]
ISKLVFTPHQLFDLHPATSGSLSLNLAAAIDVTILTTAPLAVPTKKKLGKLIIRRSSASLMELFVLPSILNADYNEKIKIILQVSQPPTKIKARQRLAQLVPLPQLAKPLAPEHPEARTGGFKFTGSVVMITLDLSTRPRRDITLTCCGHSITIKSLLDTGADTSIIDPKWPLETGGSTITGVGGVALAKCTPKITVSIDNRTVNSVLAVAPLPTRVRCLIGRDLLSQLEIVLTNDHPLGKEPLPAMLPEKLQIAPEKVQLQLKPVVGIPNELLIELRPMLQETNPTAKIVPTLRQHTVLQKITEIIQQSSISHRDPLLPIDLAIWLRKHHLLKALVQQLKKRGGEIRENRQRARQITENEPSTILLPIWLSKPLRSEKPIPKAITVFTNAIMTNLLKPVNIVTDSLYVARIVQRIEGSEIRQINNKKLKNLLIQLKLAIQTRTHPYAVIHIR